MPRKQKNSAERAPPAVPVRSLRADRKLYETWGDINRHGPFIVLAETVGKRKNQVFMPVSRANEIIEMLQSAKRDVEALPERKPAAEPTRPEVLLSDVEPGFDRMGEPESDRMTG